MCLWVLDLDLKEAFRHAVHLLNLLLVRLLEPPRLVSCQYRLRPAIQTRFIPQARERRHRHRQVQGRHNSVFRLRLTHSKIRNMELVCKQLGNGVCEIDMPSI
jgi:hypothetical protein